MVRADRAGKALTKRNTGPFCPGCGGLFEPARRDQRHCGPSCRVLACRKRTRAALDARPAPCPRCGETRLVERGFCNVCAHQWTEGSTMPNFQDETRRCHSCGEPYVWTERDQRFAHERGYLPPKRCPQCRATEKQRQRDRLARRE